LNEVGRPSWYIKRRKWWSYRYGKEEGGVLSMDDRMKREELKTEIERLEQSEDINCNRS